jgi:hypothetical protein
MSQGQGAKVESDRGKEATTTAFGPNSLLTRVAGTRCADPGQPFGIGWAPVEHPGAVEWPA